VGFDLAKSAVQQVHQKVIRRSAAFGFRSSGSGMALESALYLASAQGRKWQAHLPVDKWIEREAIN
jgi:hypothetical protein